MKHLLTAASLCLLLSLPALAQSPPNEMRRFDINWNIYSFSRQSDVNLHGGGLSFAVHLSERLAIVADTSSHTTLDSCLCAVDLTTYRFGPRLSHRSGDRITAFGHVLAGGAHARGSSLISSFGSTAVTVSSTADGFSLAVGGGVDVGIRPWFALRVIQAEYSYIRFGSLDANSNGLRVGGGLVFRFGRTAS